MGTIYRRGNRWYVQITIRGKRIRRSAGSEARAQLMLEELERHEAVARLAAVGAPAEPVQAPAPRTMTVAEFCRRWLAKADTGWSPSYRRDQEAAARRLAAWFGPEASLTAVSVERCEAFRAARRAQVSPCTVNHELRTLRQILSRAVAWGYLDRSPAAAVAFISYRQRQAAPLTTDECRQLLDGAREVDAWKGSRGGTSNEALVTVMLHTGLRATEFASLRCEDLDLREGTLRIAEAKTDRSTTGGRRQSIPVASAIHGILRVARGRRLRGVLFRSESGQAFDRHTIRHRVERCATRAKLRHITPHDLRRTFLSLLTQQVDAFAAMRLARHTQISTTQRYVGRTPDDLRRAAEAIQIEDRA